MHPHPKLQEKLQSYYKQNTKIIIIVIYNLKYNLNICILNLGQSKFFTNILYNVVLCLFFFTIKFNAVY